MTISKLVVSAGLCSALFLAGCTDPGTLNLPSDPNQNTKQGALLGGLVGAGVGAIANDSDPLLGALAGGAIGAAGGGLIGNQLDRQAAELRQQLANDGITIVNAGDRLIVTVPNDITFDTDSSTVRPALRSDLVRVGQNLVRYPNSAVQVIGHTDSDGEASYNQALSERRARSVADVLQANGVNGARISTIGLGENRPAASNLTPEGKARNRRVDIEIIPNGNT
ncbi:OmpA family protein [Ruegeria faecimaris]|uniref:Outer membrane protein OmpA n=1 Tax=Ruegeria faecimaris TaxID=686389 RepID=A0A521D8Z8_9RHOB|nr:OmpA family protein [Ruegeria faecimaris]SMO68085.1 Outer membrane protein OmpA [Ruegeria faecimaris]